MLYCCEVCKTTYNTEHDALDCEKRHAEEKAKREELDKQRNERVDEIKDIISTLKSKVDDFKNDYGFYPTEAIAGKRYANLLDSIIFYW